MIFFTYKINKISKSAWNELECDMRIWTQSIPMTISMEFGIYVDKNAWYELECRIRVWT